MKEQQDLRRQLHNSKNLHEATLEQNRHICAEKDHFQQKAALLQKQHAVAIEENHRILTVAQEEKRHLQAECERLQLHCRASNQIALVAVQQVTLFREALFELRRQTEAQLQTFQTDIACHNTHLNNLATEASKPRSNNGTLEDRGLRPLDPGTPETETQISAQTLLYRVTSKLNHTLRSLKT